MGKGKDVEGLRGRLRNTHLLKNNGDFHDLGSPQQSAFDNSIELARRGSGSKGVEVTEEDEPLEGRYRVLWSYSPDGGWL